MWPFTKLIAVSGRQPGEIAYVGDRVDNALLSAAEASLRTVFVKRGPWGYITYERGTASLEIGSLTDLPDALKTLDTDA